MKIRKVICILAAVLIFAVSLCACSAAAKTAGDMAEAVESGRYTNSFADEMYDDAGFVAEEKSAAAEITSPKPTADIAARKLIRDASLNIQTKEFDTFITQLDKSIASVGGYVEASEVYGNSYNYVSNRSAEMTARIPSESFDEFINSVSEIATVTSKSIGLKDVTGEYIDTESRIAALETEQTALLSLMEKAGAVSEIIEIQNRLTSVRGDLESYKAQLKAYDELISYSTVTLFIDEVERVSMAEQEGFFEEIKSKLSDNLYTIAQDLRDFAIWFISSLPYIAIFAVVTVVVILICRRRVKKRRIKKAAAAAAKEN